MTEPCQCNDPGWCERHQRRKTKAHWMLCQQQQRYRELWDGQAAGLPPEQMVTKEEAQRRYLGDKIHDSLARVGVTPERASKYLGDCGCRDKQQRLNKLHRWAEETIAGRLSDARASLEKLLG